ncbi:MAG: Asp-tRNA(Asn)/Glu-tRNA(Gln) amidotransferase subunit GatC [Candidatus Microgenomates bacterium]|jgi:aspartyl-tRNA(Asn)/glutamyl-tRNA(Gln) amidotransferase subunit C
MAKLTKVDVLHVAKLAKLDISEKEINKYTEQLAPVINYFSELSEIDTNDVEPTSQTTGLENVFRQDVIKGENCLNQDEAVAGSEKTYNGYFKVKAILSERTDK